MAVMLGSVGFATAGTAFATTAPAYGYGHGNGCCDCGGNGSSVNLLNLNLLNGLLGNFQTARELKIRQ